MYSWRWIFLYSWQFVGPQNKTVIFAPNLSSKFHIKGGDLVALFHSSHLTFFSLWYALEKHLSLTRVVERRTQILVRAWLTWVDWVTGGQIGQRWTTWRLLWLRIGLSSFLRQVAFLGSSLDLFLIPHFDQHWLSKVDCRSVPTLTGKIWL